MILLSQIFHPKDLRLVNLFLVSRVFQKLFTWIGFRNLKFIMEKKMFIIEVSKPGYLDINNTTTNNNDHFSAVYIVELCSFILPKVYKNITGLKWSELFGSQKSCSAAAGTRPVSTRIRSLGRKVGGVTRPPSRQRRQRRRLRERLVWNHWAVTRS